MKRVLSILAPALLAASAAAQVTPLFEIEIRSADTAVIFTSGGSFELGADALNATATATVRVRYRGTQQADLASPFLSGAQDFSLQTSGDFPRRLSPGEILTFTIQYRARASARQLSLLSIPFQETASGVPGPAGSLSLGLSGTAPEIAVAYFLAADGNAVPLGAGQTIVFPDTLLGASSQATLLLVNRGSRAGVVSSAAVSGAAFRPQGLPLFPQTIDPGRELRFGLVFNPQAPGVASGSLTLGLLGGGFQAQLEGAGVRSSFLYEVLSGGDASPIEPNQSFTVPDTDLGTSSSRTFRVRNTGSATGVITLISVSGSQFSLTDLPATPLSLAPGASTTFTVNFNPTSVGTASGRLRVGDATFDVSAAGLGSRLTYTYSSGSNVSTTLTQGGPVVFPPVPLGGVSALSFTVRNNGNRPANVQSIALNNPLGRFRLSGVPPLPAQLEPAAAFTFELRYLPASLNVSTDTLLVDTVAFTLSGSATPPPSLPAQQISGPSGDVAPLQQPEITLALSSPYPLTLTGTMTLSVVPSGFNADPAVQFSTGGRAVSFTIPANATQAIFNGVSPAVRIQTGSVAGVIRIDTAFRVGDGVDVTPQNPARLEMNVVAAAPQLLSARIELTGTQSFNVVLTGLATTREIDAIEVQVTPSSSLQLDNVTFALPVSDVFANYYRSSEAQSFGSLFSATIPFTLQNPPAGALSDLIPSLQVRLRNRNGTSNSITAQTPR